MIEALASKDLSGISTYSNPDQRRETKNQSQLEMQDFLQLLTSQITNQDPLEPMKDTEFISQMANIASLEQMQQFTSGFSKFADSHNSMLAHSFLGKQVTLDDGGREITGKVESVEKDSEGIESLVINGNKHSPSSVIKVSLNDS